MKLAANIIAFCITAALLKTGCSRPESPASATSTEVPKDPVATAIDKAPSPNTEQASKNPLPFGISIQETHSIHSDRVFTDEKGIERRKVTFELAPEALQSAFHHVTEQLQSIGFKQSGANGGGRKALFHRNGIWIAVTSADAPTGDDKADPKAALGIQWPTSADQSGSTRQ